MICGYGRVARELADALEARSLRYLVIEYNPEIARSLRDRGVPVIYGDAANPAVLEHAHLERARLLAILMPDARAAELATRYARGINPRLDVVTPGQSTWNTWSGCAPPAQPRWYSRSSRPASRSFGTPCDVSASVAWSCPARSTGRRSAFYRRTVDDFA